MSNFFFYLSQGANHILDFDGLDHFYFIVSFCLLYTFKDWRTILGLVTAFTLGHSITLLLAGLDLVSFQPELVETLIPITILISCLNNFYQLLFSKKVERKLTLTYGILFFFGLIHGLGFSSFLKMMLFEDEAILVPLLGFNIGIEIAQLLIVVGFLTLFIVLQKLPFKWYKVLLVPNSVVSFLVLQLLI